MNLHKQTGWTPLEPINDNANKQNEEKARAIASLYRQTFETEPGQRVLEMLVKGFLMRPVVRPDYTQFQAGIREGQADIVRQILAQIEFAKSSE